MVFKPTASGIQNSHADRGSTTLWEVRRQLQSERRSASTSVVVSPDTTQTFTAGVGTTSAFRTFTVTNEQANTPLIFSPALLTGDFIQSATTCPIGGAGLGGTGTIASCTISVEFNPSIGGVRSGQLQVNDNAITTPQVVNLTGTGTSPLTLTPGTLPFSAQTVGTVSAAKVLTLTNHETESETFSIAAVGMPGRQLITRPTPTAQRSVIAANSSCT